MPKIELLNIDCMEYMKGLSDKAFDLAIVDPPYGGGGGVGEYDHLTGGVENSWTGRERSRFGGIFDKYKIKVTRTGGGYAKKYGSKIKHWDIAPGKEFFERLGQISKNQIIWGGNYFSLPGTRCFIIWRKLTISESFSMAMCEYAWTSFNENAKYVEIAPQNDKGKKRFHPTQKPVALYKWILKKYAKPGDTIFDSHGGSMSLAIACHDMGHDCVICELDKGYYDAAVKRFNNHVKQGRLF